MERKGFLLLLIGHLKPAGDKFFDPFVQWPLD